MTIKYATGNDRGQFSSPTMLDQDLSVRYCTDEDEPVGASSDHPWWISTKVGILITFSDGLCTDDPELCILHTLYKY